MRATAVVPVKRFAVAKSRLAPGVEETRKPELVAAMVADVLEAIGSARLVERTIVVSQEPRAAELATAAGADLGLEAAQRTFGLCRAGVTEVQVCSAKLAPSVTGVAADVEAGPVIDDDGRRAFVDGSWREIGRERSRGESDERTER